MSGQIKWLKGLIGTAGALALIVSLTGEATAGSVSYSNLTISNFIISNDDDGVQLATTDFSILIALNTGSTSATLNGANISNTDGPSAGNVDPNNVCVGGSCPVSVSNTFTFIQPDGSEGSFAQADARLQGAVVSGLPAGTPATATTQGQVQLLGGNSGSTSTSVTTGSTFQFQVNEDTSIRLNFDGDGDLVARLNADAVPLSLAFASYSFEITITVADSGAVVFQWSPDGTVNNDIIGGTEVTDDFTLVDSRTALLANDNLVVDETGSFEANTVVLSADIRYLFSISHTSITNGLKTVIPEPATLALFAGGLMILGFFGLRGRRPEDALGAS